MTEYVVKERIGLPVWDGENVVDTKHFFPGDAITDGDFDEARQSEEEQAMLVKFNCLTQEVENA